MKTKRKLLKDWILHRLSSLCFTHNELCSSKESSELDIVLQRIQMYLIPAMKNYQKKDDEAFRKTIADIIHRMQLLEDVPIFDKALMMKQKVSELVQCLRVVETIFSVNQADEVIDAIYAALKKDIGDIVSLHVDSWDDASQNGLPRSAQEDYFSKIMPTQPLDTDEKNKHKGAITGTICLDVFIGMDFERSPGTVLTRIFESKIKRVQEHLQKALETLRFQHDQKTFLLETSVKTEEDINVHEKSTESVSCIELAVERANLSLSSNNKTLSELSKLHDEYTKSAECIWNDAKQIRHWDFERYAAYTRKTEESYNDFRSSLKRLKNSGISMKHFHADRNVVQSAYCRLIKHAEKLKKKFASEVSILYDQFLVENAFYLGPLHAIRTNKTYAEEFYMQVGFRFAMPDVQGAVIHGDSQNIGPGESVELDLSVCEKKINTPKSFMESEICVLCESVDEFGVKLPLQIIPDKYKMYFMVAKVPTMVKSRFCALKRLEKLGVPFQRFFEDSEELGGHFIVNGSEKLLRILTCPRTNIPLCIERDHFAKNGKNFSNKAITFQSQMGSGRIRRVFFHYLTNGEICAAFFRRRIHFVPVTLLLLCLQNTSLYTLKVILDAGVQSEQAMLRIDALIRHHGTKPYAGVLGARAHIIVLGRLFRESQQEFPSNGSFPLLPMCSTNTQNVDAQKSDEWYGLYVLRYFLFPHLNGDFPLDDFDNFASEIQREHSRKFELLVHVVHRLYHFVDGAVAKDSVDKQSNQGVFTPGRILVGAMSDIVNRTLDSLTRITVKHYHQNFDDALLNQTWKRGGFPQEMRKFFELISSEKISATEPLPDTTKRLNRIFSTGSYQIDRSFWPAVPQVLGLSVTYERLNAFRQIELLRCVHRGKSVADSRSSEIRRCQQESWGFFCVVNTPDGHLCGVSQQLALSAKITSDIEINRCLKQGKKSFPKQNVELGEQYEWLGMRPVVISLLKVICEYITSTASVSYEQSMKMPAVYIDGCIVARIAAHCSVTHLASEIRSWKAHPDCPFALCEVVEQVAPYPGSLLIFTSAGSLMRPVQVIGSNSCMMVGPWEQTFLNIAAVHADVIEAKLSGLPESQHFKYIEPNPAATLSYTANTIPFFEHNCSPRNLFVCGILKQSMGNHIPNVALRQDSKVYLMPTTQRNLVGTELTEAYDMSTKSVNLNAVVAIMSYSGLDMEDAIVMNKSCTERGMFDGHILAGRTIAADMKMRRSALEADKRSDGTKTTIVFHNISLSNGPGKESALVSENVAPNGLPLLRPTQQKTFREPTHFSTTPLYVIAKKISRPNGVVRYVDHKVFSWGEFTESYEDAEAGWVHSVLPVAFDGPDPTEIFVLVRKNRCVVVGDKFSSRHGQKGTLSYLMSQSNLPFCMNSGIVPDILINPHAFPSRMTVGMMLELAAGKAVAHSGKLWNASPWGGDVRWDPMVAQHVAETASKSNISKKVKKTKSDGDSPEVANSSAVNVIRSELKSYGLEPFAGEELVSGETGEPIEGDVFIGICGYQKLRHLVKDKWQVRARTDHVRARVVRGTGQPQGGRKRGGGTRVGEMERDALLSHGATEVLIDRLMTCSDQTRGYVCKDCGGMFSIAEKCATAAGTFKFCYYCAQQKKDVNLVDSSNIVLMDMPQVLKHLVSEMKSVGVRIAMRF